MNRAVFFDRDGVINVKAKEHDYIKTWEEFELIPDIIDVMQHVQSRGYKIIIVTNQRGIARGLMTINDLNFLHENLRQLFTLYDISITDIFYCPHDIDEKCNCRKPEVGMFLKAKVLHDLDFEQSYLIGDSLTDIIAARKLNIKSILYDESYNNKIDLIADYRITKLLQIVNIIN